MTTRDLPVRQTKANDDRILVVATNSDYAKLCARSISRLRANANVKLLAFPQWEHGKLRRLRRRSTVVVSRLSDITRQVLDFASAGAATKQLVFLEELPVKGMATRLLPLNIRNPERIHIATERDRSAIERLIYRLVSGLAEQDGCPSIVDAWMEADHLVLLSPAFARLEIPLSKLARYIGTDKAEGADFEIDEDGRFLHWPHADVHLGWAQFQQIIDPASVIAAASRTAEYNKRYGAAIRAFRESKGLKQTDIVGITDRQLRRVEHGQQAASKGTLEALAKAHLLSLDEYVDRLAKLVRSIN